MQGLLELHRLLFFHDEINGSCRSDHAGVAAQHQVVLCCFMTDLPRPPKLQDGLGVHPQILSKANTLCERQWQIHTDVLYLEAGWFSWGCFHVVGNTNTPLKPDKHYNTQAPAPSFRTYELMM